MRLIIIGNFPSDGQESMIRFTQMLALGFREAGHETEIWYPRAYFSARSKSTISGLDKWLGYLDKWVIFPLTLRWRLRDKTLKNPNVRFHVSDHSNSPYLNYLPADRTAITCHDVLAIRGALGYTDAYCPATGPGKILQRWILNNLDRSKLVAAVTQTTLRQLNELALNQTNRERLWQVIPNGFNADFRPMGVEERKELLETAGIKPGESFLLCVGSGQPRKNRRLLLDMAVALGNQWQGRICYAGQPLASTLREQIKTLGLQDRVIEVIKPNHPTLVALYSACSAFVFPSFSEGFGWPVIEAQACGAPVLASTMDPMPEVSGGAALHADPTQPQAFAKAFMSLQNEALRMDLIERGFVNCKRFELTKMINLYLDLHKH